MKPETGGLSRLSYHARPIHDERRAREARRETGEKHVPLRAIGEGGVDRAFELREACRGRHQLVRLRTRVAQMIRALLLRCDAGEPPGTRLYAPQALAWLAAAQLPPDADRTLRRLERLYQAIHVDAQAADAEVRRRSADDPIAVALTALVGIGPVMALTIRAEVGDMARFRRGAALACYDGLVPRVEISADRVYRGRITRDGSQWLRWALVEMARHAIYEMALFFRRFRPHGVGQRQSIFFRDVADLQVVAVRRGGVIALERGHVNVISR